MRAIVTFMYYNFELVMAGAILLTAMLLALRIKRSSDIDETDVSASKSTPDNPDDTRRENTDSQT